MPRQSLRQSLPQQLDDTSLRIARARLENAHQGIDSNSSSSTSDSVPGSDNSSSTTSLFISPPSPISPIWSDSESSATNNTDSTTEPDRQYARLLNAIVALRDEVEYARILEKSDVPMMRAAQLCLLDHFVDYRPHLFRMRLRVSAPIFDRILDQISIHPIFHSNSHNRQLPVAVQLAIFLFRAGHYGNAVALDYVAQWAGVSVGSVVNCTNRVMAAVLDEHDLFVNIPPVDSEDMERARAFTESWTCPVWRKGVFAADGSSIPLFEKPCFFGESFYDRKSRYSLHCQVCARTHVKNRRLTCYSLRLCRTIFLLSTTDLVILEAPTTHGRFRGLTSHHVLRSLFQMATGCGQIVHIRWKRGVSSLSRSLKGDDFLGIKTCITNIYQRCVLTLILCAS